MTERTRERLNEIKAKARLIEELSEVYRHWVYDMDSAELRAYQKKDKPEYIVEVMLIFWKNGGYCCENCNHNSKTANARVLAGMLDGGKYSYVDEYKMISNSDEWERVV